VIKQNKADTYTYRRKWHHEDYHGTTSMRISARGVLGGGADTVPILAESPSVERAVRNGLRAD
jgi:hypothetical protein